MVASNEQRLPARIGRYEVVGLLGEGGFGRVYRAIDPDLRRDVAIKVPHSRVASDPRVTEACLHEARILANLQHKSIVRIYDYRRDSDFACYIVSQFIDGKPLDRVAGERSDGHGPAIEDAIDIVTTVASILACIHVQGVFHCDIKPANILIDEHGEVFLVDFGLAGREEQIEDRVAVGGTAPYASPEQIRGECHRIDGRSDLFSLGVVLFELLTGRRPFDGETPDEIMEKIVSDATPRLRDLVPELDETLERVCAKALAKRKLDRYQTATELADDLQYCRDVLRGRVARGDGTSSEKPVMSTVLRGLRAFDDSAADFFLELLPGPRDRHGIPDSVRFWLTRIEARRDAPRACVLFGASGSGKSSLVRAGILPRLSSEITAITIEASSSGELVERIRGMIATRLGRDIDESLPAALRNLREELREEKIVIVIDQFEQWLHAESEHDYSELASALCECDGTHVQCILIVRDDFWVALNRFLDRIACRQIDGENVALVDLFDRSHARVVLERVGRASGRLPAAPERLSRKQSAFLDRAIRGLCRPGGIAPVELTLFAETVRRRDWTDRTLDELGGLDGLGCLFLEETFHGPSAPLPGRRHAAAAESVLAALLPGRDEVIRGAPRARSELLAASGYEAEADFDDLMRLLDGDLRVVTPLDPQIGESPESRYQLTHDSLVAPIRQWIDRRRSRTRRGRAGLLLARRAEFWHARREPRQLPTLVEWLAIRSRTRREWWSERERRVMRAAGRRHRRRALVAAGIVIAVTLVGVSAVRWRQDRATLDRILRASPMGVLDLLEKEEVRPRVANWLEERVVEGPSETEGADRSSLKAFVALARARPGDLIAATNGLLLRLLARASALELTALRACIDAAPKETRRSVDSSLRQSVQHAPRGTDALCRLVCALDTIGREVWRRHGDRVAHWMLDQSEGEVALLAARLRSSRDVVLSTFDGRFRAEKEGARGVNAALALATVLEGDRAALIERLELAAARQVRPLVRALASEPIEELRSELARRLRELDSANDPEFRARATLIATLAASGRFEDAWKALSLSSNPVLRGRVIQTLEPADADPIALVRRVSDTSDDSVRGALLLALGEYRPDDLPPRERDAFLARLDELFTNHRSAGVHGAARWLLQTWNRRLPGLPTGRRSNRDWFVPPSGPIVPGGLTMAIVHSPAVVDAKSDAIGDPETRVPAIFAIATLEITAKQLSVLTNAEPPESATPATSNIYLARAFCEHLSDLENIPADQRCYVRGKRGFVPRPRFRELTGYRLAIEAEWMLAYRAGLPASTAVAIDKDSDLAPRYSWIDGAVYASRPVGRKRPNDLGLFDMLGNEIEWTETIPSDERGKFVMLGAGATIRRFRFVANTPTTAGTRVVRTIKW